MALSGPPKAPFRGTPKASKPFSFCYFRGSPLPGLKKTGATREDIQAPRHDFSINFYVFLCLPPREKCAFILHRKIEGFLRIPGRAPSSVAERTKKKHKPRTHFA